MADRYTYEPLNTGDILRSAPGKKSKDRVPAVLLFIAALVTGFVLGRIVEHKMSYLEGKRAVLDSLPLDCIARYYLPEGS